MNITIDNLIDLQGIPVAGQRVVKVAPGIWLPVGLGGTYPPAAPSDSSPASLRAGVIVSQNGVLKVQPLSFTDTIPSDSGSAQDYTMRIFNTGMEEPDYISIPSDIPKDYTLYAPFSSNQNKAKTGQTIVNYSGVSYTTIDGLACAYCNSDSSARILTKAHYNPNADNFSLSVWGRSGFYFANRTGFRLCSLGTGVLQFTAAGDMYGRATSSTSYNFNQWHHVVLVRSGNTFTLYVDGISAATSTYSGSIDLSIIDYGYWYNSAGSSQNSTISYVKALRLYDRVLSSTQITALSQEFTPTA